MIAIQTIFIGTNGYYSTLSEALLAVPYRRRAILNLASGIYREKVFCEKRNITITGAGPGKTVIAWGDGAYHKHADGRNTGTFRSYTAFFGGERLRLENLSVINEAGDGREAGQGIAVYADAREAVFKNVEFIGRQDTLFLAPLPKKERIVGGFLGPRALSPRVLTRQNFIDCRIEGDVDFIFGGADAVFDRCEIISRDRGEAVNGYAAAPSGFSGGLGLVFRDCRFTSPDCRPGSVYLGRPWRPHGKAALLRCFIGEHINPAGWASWGSGKNLASFSEYANSGPGASLDNRADWVVKLDAAQAEILDKRASEHVERLKKALHY
ncbi:MAG: pectin esterase [Clostridiales bacterium]|nr:pectin esterase [Clostridiales bacterium]